MSESYQAARARIDQALNGNVGQRLTPELAVGLFMVIDECFRKLIEPVAEGANQEQSVEPVAEE